MKLLKPLGRIDDWLIFALQHAYEFLLDAFGLRVGTFRLALILLPSFFAIAINLRQVTQIASYYASHHQMEHAALVWIGLGPFFETGIIWLGVRFLGRFRFSDQSRDNRDQKAGRLQAINRRALFARASGDYRWLILGMSVLLSVTFGKPALAYIIGVGAAWLNTIMVRDRNRSRFSIRQQDHPIMGAA